MAGTNPYITPATYEKPRRPYEIIEHTCGGVCACSTCHVIVREGLETCNEATEDEEDQLEEAPGLVYQSRLGCQCVPNGTRRVLVEIPRWNRNAVKETAHE
jgi:2Fe-2S ferredoxin